MIKARPRSGFYVADRPRISSEFPEAADAGSDRFAEEVSISAQLYQLMTLWRERKIETFGSLHPSSDLVPTQELLTHMRRFLRQIRPDRPPVTSTCRSP